MTSAPAEYHPERLEQFDAWTIYETLYRSSSDSERRALAGDFLRDLLGDGENLPTSEMPLDPGVLEEWMMQQTLEVGEQYARYLESRRAGGPRLQFTSRAHAIWYLQRIAPTKLVDGAWLYGTLRHWEDPRFRPLIRTYLEELGDGDPTQNHVLLYRQILDRFGEDEVGGLDPMFYVQGAIQLAFGYGGDEFLPELLGYNLGYERIPLHLMITTFELHELDIDPYYFTLHITVDNADSGHARKAVAAVIDAIPQTGDREAFMRRVANGFRLSDAGPGADAIIRSFDLERELVAMLERKRVFGKNMHSDFSLVEGRTVNQWMEQEGQMAAFLEAMEKRRWIKRHEDPENSRFWQSIEGEGAQMYGVFSESERQLIHDWIAGDSLDNGGRVEPDESEADRRSRPRIFRRARPSSARAAAASVDPVKGDPHSSIGELVRSVESLPAEEQMSQLIEFMSPSRHMTATGLTATRLFRELFH